MSGFDALSEDPISAIPAPQGAASPFINWLASFPARVQPPISAAYSYFSKPSPDEVLNLPVPFLPRLPDVAARVLPLPQGGAFSPVFNIATAILSWMPRVVQAPPVVPADKPNFFSHIFPLNFKLPWLPVVRDAAPRVPAHRPSIFSPFFPAPVIAILSWMPRITHAVPPVPADKPVIFSPFFPAPVIPVNPGNWTPAHTPASIGRQAAPQLKRLRRINTLLGRRRADDPTLKKIQKQPPTLT